MAVGVDRKDGLEGHLFLMDLHVGAGMDWDWDPGAGVVTEYFEVWFCQVPHGAWVVDHEYESWRAFEEHPEQGMVEE